MKNLCIDMLAVALVFFVAMTSKFEATEINCEKARVWDMPSYVYVAYMHLSLQVPMFELTSNL